jgi:hypothetical protein
VAVVFKPIVGFQHLESVVVGIFQVKGCRAPRRLTHCLITGIASNGAGMGVHLVNVPGFYLDGSNPEVAWRNFPAGRHRFKRVSAKHFEGTSTLQVQHHAGPLGDGLAAGVAVHQWRRLYRVEKGDVHAKQLPEKLQ